MDLSESAEEILENLWILGEKDGKTNFTLKSLQINIEADPFKELERFNLVSLSGTQVSLTPKGRFEAENVVRRHRLAERLLVDVLNIEASIVEEAACKFEHVIRRGVEENVCVLLGHPKVCPHGRSIPRGKCCFKNYERASKIIVPLSKLEPNQEGRIMYINTRGKGRLQKLMAMGIAPGMTAHVIQRFPSHVFQIGQTQIAVDEEIADEIFVLKTNST